MTAPTPADTRAAAVALLQAVHADDSATLCQILADHTGGGTEAPIVQMARAGNLLFCMGRLTEAALREFCPDPDAWISAMLSMQADEHER